MSAACGAAAAAYYCLHNSERRRREEEEEYRRRHPIIKYRVKVDILKYRPEKTAHIYQCGEYQNYMYSRMVPSTGYIKDWVIRFYHPGIIIQYPRPDTARDPVSAVSFYQIQDHRASRNTQQAHFCPFSRPDGPHWRSYNGLP